MIIHICDKCKGASDPMQSNAGSLRPENWQEIRLYQIGAALTSTRAFMLCNNCCDKLGLEPPVRHKAAADQLFDMFCELVEEAINERGVP